MSDSEAARPRDCQVCGAQCCRHVALEIDKPTCKQDYDNIRWYLLHEAISVFVDHDGDWHVEFPSACSALDENNRCTRYAERPKVCRDYPAEDAYCEYESDESPYAQRFDSAEAFERYLESKGKEWRFRKLKD